MPDTHDDVHVACLVAVAAANAICEVAERARLLPTEKDDDQGPVTEADLNADAAARDVLARLRPDDVVVTEETWALASTLPDAERVWFVDPLDGTKSFVEGRDDYVVMIGLCVDGIPVVGALLQPTSGDLWSADVRAARCERRTLPKRSGGPAYDVDDLTAVPTSLTTSTAPSRARFVLSRHHTTAASEWMTQQLGVDIVRKSSVGLKIGLIVDGDAEAYLTGSRKIKVWDTCAPTAVLVAAGGVVTDLDDNPLDYRSQAALAHGVFAATADVHASMLPQLQEHARRYQAEQAAKKSDSSS